MNLDQDVEVDLKDVQIELAPSDFGGGYSEGAFGLPAPGQDDSVIRLPELEPKPAN